MPVKPGRDFLHILDGIFLSAVENGSKMLLIISEILLHQRSRIVLYSLKRNDIVLLRLLVGKVCFLPPYQYYVWRKYSDRKKRYVKFTMKISCLKFSETQKNG